MNDGTPDAEPAESGHLHAIAKCLSAGGLACRIRLTRSGSYLVAYRERGWHQLQVIVEDDGPLAVHCWPNPGASPDDIARAVSLMVEAASIITPPHHRQPHLHRDLIARYDGAITECVGDVGMPGPQDQVAPERLSDHARPPHADPPPRTPAPREPREADRPRESGRPSDDLHERLERLPLNHPSSPYRDDGTRKPPPPDLSKLELPLPSDSRSKASTDHATSKPKEQADLPAQDSEDKPQIGPDGSWEWKSRHLSPEQSHIADRTLEKCRVAEGRDADGLYGECGLTPAMRRIEAQLEHGRLVEGTDEFALKSSDRFKEKLADRIRVQPEEPVAELAARIHDAIRYTFVYDDRNYTKGVRQTESALERQGHELIVRRPGWEGPDYKGLNSQWRDSESEVFFEVQFHTHGSWEAKQQTHTAYEKLADPRTPPHERERLQEYQRKVTAQVVVPEGAVEINPYRKKGF